MKELRQYRGRIAPTPSGVLHAGNIATFKIAQERARKQNGTLVLRIEDIDSCRSKPELVEQVYADLKKAGITWDEGDDVGGNFAPYTQSKRTDFYKSALLKLIELDLVYPSNASRKEIKSLAKMSQQKFEDCPPEAIFPTELRPKNFDKNANIFNQNWRFKVPENEEIFFHDELLGDITLTSQVDFGDFLVWRKSDEPSYELAVVVDDIAMQITEVVRGSDLLVSTARQLLLYSAFNATPPKFAHTPIIKDPLTNNKLSKSSLKNLPKNLNR